MCTDTDKVIWESRGLVVSGLSGHAVAMPHLRSAPGRQDNKRHTILLSLLAMLYQFHSLQSTATAPRAPERGVCPINPSRQGLRRRSASG